jgi:Rps23 Pro-64 3,4-dihydroxylase Tpa1-like proline 4-hydroxylase
LTRIMAHGHDVGTVSLLNHKIMVKESVSRLAAEYKSARPFPHIIIDNMFEERLLDQLVEEMPSLTAEKFIYCDDEHLRQYGLRSAMELGETGFQLVAFLHSAAFLHFLTEVTGIRELLPDPYLQGGGYHVMPRGGKFDVHVDRNTAYETGLTRRLSLITYLNKSWRHEYGGQFEMWTSDGSRCEAAVEPLFNRTVIFEIAEKNFHGVPSSIACPPGRSRNAFVVYYHTVHTQDQNVSPHSSLYSPSYSQKDSVPRNRRTVVRIARALCPPIFMRAAKRLLRPK